jgi:hypothetical protein
MAATPKENKATKRRREVTYYRGLYSNTETVVCISRQGCIAEVLRLSRFFGATHTR